MHETWYLKALEMYWLHFKKGNTQHSKKCIWRKLTGIKQKTLQTKKTLYKLNLKKTQAVADISQGSHTGELNFCNWLAVWLALRSIKSIVLDFLNHICYFSIYELSSSPYEAGWTLFQTWSTFEIVEVPVIEPVTSWSVVRHTDL